MAPFMPCIGHIQSSYTPNPKNIELVSNCSGTALNAKSLIFPVACRGRIRFIVICDSDNELWAQEAWTARSGTCSLYLLAARF
jgi:hypothetical protein